MCVLKKLIAAKNSRHWESDSAVPKKTRVAINVIHVRVTPLVRLTKLANQTAIETANAICHKLGNLQPEALRSITYDNGTENFYHEQVNETLETCSYFCAPSHSWEKRAVENTNGLLRPLFQRKWA